MMSGKKIISRRCGFGSPVSSDAKFGAGLEPFDRVFDKLKC